MELYFYPFFSFGRINNDDIFLPALPAAFSIFIIHCYLSSSSFSLRIDFIYQDDCLNSPQLFKIVMAYYRDDDNQDCGGKKIEMSVNNTGNSVRYTNETSLCFFLPKLELLLPN